MTKIIDDLQRDLFQLQAVLAVAGVALDEGTPKQYQEKICWGSLFDVVHGLTQKALNNVETLQYFSEVLNESVPVAATAEPRREQFDANGPTTFLFDSDHASAAVGETQL